MSKNTRLAFVSIVVLALAAAGCSSGNAPSEEEEDGVVSSADALTSEERALGEAWDGREEDDLSSDEEAALSMDEDPYGDLLGPASHDVDPQSVRPLAGCTRTTGYTKGKAMSICTTTINGKAVDQTTATAFLRMRAAAARAGVSLIVVSGFRTMQKQRELYALYKAGRGNLAAPPGYSNHQSGHALDLNAKAKGVNAWLSRNAGSFGFRRTVPSENWHYERR